MGLGRPKNSPIKIKKLIVFYNFRTDVPHIERGDDLTALITLIDHFDPPGRFEDAILDPRLLLALQRCA
jgi:hypothetical protein